MKFNKKGQILTALGNIGIGLAVFAIIIAVMFLILGNVKTQQIEVAGDDPNCLAGGNCSLGVNATSELESAMDDIPGWVPILVTVVIGGLIIMAVRRFGQGSM